MSATPTMPKPAPHATGTLRIALADDEADTREYLQEILKRLGHQVMLAQGGRQLAEQCRVIKPDLVITDIKMPDMDGIDAAIAINRERETPVILVSAHANPDFLRRAGEHPIMGYLIKPVKPADVENAVNLAVARFSQFQVVRKEAQDLRRALEDRKLIERSKGIVMRRLCVDEQESFQRMKRFASNHNRKLADVAQSILDAEEIFHELEAV
jgi:two-component system, response regulator PdtaR